MLPEFDGDLTLGSGVDYRTMPLDRFLATWRSWVRSRHANLKDGSERWQQVLAEERAAVEQERAALLAAEAQARAALTGRASTDSRRRTRRSGTMSPTAPTTGA